MTDEKPNVENDGNKDDASTGVRFLIDFVPLLIFFAVFKFVDIFWATGVFMISIGASMVASKILRGHIPTMLWFTAGIVLVMGGMTIYLQDERFVKIKPTLVYSLFSGILIFGLLRGKSYLQLVMDAAFPPLTDAGWNRLTWNWALFFAAMAGLNEAIWRNVDTDTWVNIKTWGFIPLLVLFTLAQMPVLMKHQIEEEGEEGSEDDTA